MPNKKKKGPGRPKKTFIAKPKAKRSGPGRPKKVLLPAPRKGIRGFFTTNVLHAPRKDNIILLLFVISLFLFVFSLYVTSLRSQKTVQITSDTQESTEIPNVQTGNIPYPQTAIPAGEETTVSGDQAKIDLLKSFYDALNAKDITALYQLADKNLKATNAFQTYYSKNRLTIFLGGLQGEVSVQNIQLQAPVSTTSSAQQITYMLQYALKDGQTFTENRSVVLIKRGEEYKIGKIMCDTQGCSQMPFFNPAKYGIK